MARKKIVLIIVEGPSDATALERYFVRFFDNERIVTKIMHGDITTKKGLHQANIKAYIGNRIKEWEENDKFNKKDIDRIIHIVDMDGAYIDDSAIQLNEDCSKTVYKEECIETISVNKIKDRNQQKRKILNTLSSIHHEKGLYKGVPYYIYYMSCNLDHVLYNLQNATDDEKEYKALDFSEKYIDNLQDFVDFMCESDFSVCQDVNVNQKVSHVLI